MRSTCSRLGVALFVALAVVAGCNGKKPGKPCKETGSSCLDPKTALVCRSSVYVPVACAGPLACTRYQDHANCDTSVALPGQTCMGEEDEYACTNDKKRALVCKGGRFEPYLECRGKAGCTMLGRLASCDNSIATKGDLCKTQGATACTDDSKQMLICRDGRFEVYRFCRGQFGCFFKGEQGEPPSCDESVSTAGDPCGRPGEVVCSTDGKTELVCQGGVFTKSITCKTACTVTNRPGRPIDCR